MIKLSVNINKVVIFWNVCGGNVLNVVKVVLDCESFGVDGIMVYFCLDECYICCLDVYDLCLLFWIEFNIEGYFFFEFIDLVLKVKFY